MFVLLQEKKQLVWGGVQNQEVYTFFQWRMNNHYAKKKLRLKHLKMKRMNLFAYLD